MKLKLKSTELVSENNIFKVVCIWNDTIQSISNFSNEEEAKEYLEFVELSHNISEINTDIIFNF